MHNNSPDLPAELAGITLPEWAEFIAQDADGTWWAYEVHPNQHDIGWYENEVGRIRRLAAGARNPGWESSFRKLV
jgi:hypothetical protein